MNHKGTISLETERLILRRFTINDTAMMFKNWTADANAAKYARQASHNSIEETKLYCNDIVNSYSNGNFYFWAIVLKDIDEPVGRINITQQNEAVEMVHISFMLGEFYWGKGYATEALTEIIRFFFEDVGVNRIEGRNDPQNPASGKAMQKCGFQYEGLLRQGGRNSYGLVDCEQYALLAKDYFLAKRMKKKTIRFLGCSG